jgi:hypothetical protein
MGGDCCDHLALAEALTKETFRLQCSISRPKKKSNLKRIALRAEGLVYLMKQIV